MKLSKDQKNKIRLTLAWRDFSMACDKKRREKTEEEVMKVIEQIVNNKKRLSI